ncbi:MAG: aminotransferase class IV [Verrucomicrobiota bacterium]|nr:aminotransferase class IV [Verrucomicrobiota bacterium]
MSEARAPIASRVYHRGYDLGIETQTYRPLFGGLKTGNYWANLIAFNNGVVRKKNESLLFNADGALISACMANVFLVDENRTRTPALSSGARRGVVREWVIAKTGAEEANLTRDDVFSCGEMFLTSSWLGVMPVASVEGQELHSREVSTMLRAEYRRLSS